MKKRITKRKRVKPISDKRRVQIKEYLAKRAVFLRLNYLCEFPGCWRHAVDVHHTRGRAGKLLTDEQFWVGLCRPHHEWVGENPLDARKLGLLCELGQWNRSVA